jgi:hypothetical protein
MYCYYYITLFLQVVIDKIDPTQPCPALPKTVNLARRVNRARQKLRPKDPTDLDFELDTSYITDDFLRKDVPNEARRHVVFSSDTMLSLLAKAKTW